MNSQNNKILINLSFILSYIVYALALAVGLYRVFFYITDIFVLHPAVLLREFNVNDFLHTLLISTGIMIMIAAACNYSSKENVVYHKEKIISLFPLIFLLLESGLKATFYTPVFFLIISGLTIYRLLLSFELDLSKDEKNAKSRKIFPLVIFVIFIILVLNGFYLQSGAWRSFNFMWADWGIFLDIARSVFSGCFGYSRIHDFNHFSIHFSPALIILSPFMLFKNVEIFFLLSSLFIYSGGIIIYYYSRYLKLSAKIAFLLAMIYFLTPGIINSNLSLFYGFRENFMALPAILLTAYFWDKKKYIPMLALLVFSILIKESTLVFLACLGAIFCLQKKYKTGLILFSLSTLLFLLIFFVYFPWMRDTVSYSHVYRYEGLGKDTFSIIAAAFVNPTVFWGRFLRPPVICYLLTLFVPFFILTGIRPLVCLAGGVILFFTCLQTDEVFINIQVWYQIFPLLGIYLCVLWNVGDFNKGAIKSKWLKWLQYGLPCRSNAVILSSAVAACTSCLALSMVFWGQVPFGKIFYPSFKADYSSSIDSLKKMIPPGAKTTVTIRTAPHMFFNNIEFSKSAKYSGDYVLLEFMANHEDELKENMQLRNALLKDKNYFPVAVEEKQGLLLMLFSRGNKAQRMPYPKSSSCWNKLRINLPSRDKHFESKVKFENSGGKTYARFYIKFKKCVPCDIRFTFILSNSRSKHKWSFFAGKGLLPAYLWKAGQVYCFSAEIPPGFIPDNGFMKTQKYFFNDTAEKTSK